MPNFVLQIRGWKQWEQETSTHYYEFSNGMLLLAVKAKLCAVACYDAIYVYLLSPFWF